MACNRLVALMIFFLEIATSNCWLFLVELKPILTELATLDVLGDVLLEAKLGSKAGFPTAIASKSCHVEINERFG